MMSVFHLKYRPGSVADLDLIDVSEKLSKILASKEIPQAYLLAGPKGSGKTSAARVMARVLNCLKPNGIEPCNECANCKEILGGSSIDIIEIDAASNRGIDDIRSLKDKAYFLPSKLKNKVFVIDEVHMLTKEAFNALLKLIEEPPEHTYFILCTTDPQKIPETVVSRLVRLNFRKGSKKELKRSLEKIIKGEGIKMEEKAKDLLVDSSDGSFRNLHRTFNEIYLQYGQEIKAVMVKEFLEAMAGGYDEWELEEDLAEGRVKVILEKMEKLADKGVDFVQLRERWLEHFQRNILVEYGLGEKEREPVLKGEQLRRLINFLIGASKIEKEVGIEQLPLELAIIDFVGARPGKRSGGEVKVSEEPEVEEPIKEKKKTTVKAEKKEVKEEETEVTDARIGIEQIEREWANLLTRVRPFNHSVEAFLRATRPKTVKGKVLVVEVFYPFHKERLEELKNRQIVEKCLTEIFGEDMIFECRLGKDKKPPLVIENNTPMESVSPDLAKEEGKEADIYDVAKEIFG
jgi:DNA polymerase-3 subunit gamma/tau